MGLGYEPDKIVGKCIIEFIHPDDLPVVLSAIEKVFKDCSGGKLRCKNAQENYALMDGASKFLMDYGKIMGILITARDITEKKRIEQALRV